MTTLLATRITDRLAVLLADCQGTAYPSQCGTTVLVGQVKGAEQQAPAIFVIPELSRTDRQYGSEIVTRDYRLAAFARLSDHPDYSEHGLIDQVIADVREVMESRDAQFRAGLVSLGAEVRFVSATPGYHEDGGDLVGAALQYTLHFNQASPA